MELRRPRWPPFFATSIFLPRFKIRLTNKGEALAKTNLAISIKASDGPLGEALSQKEGWLSAELYEQEQWEPGTSRKLTVTIRPRFLPRAGTYVVRFTVIRYDPQQAPYKELAESTDDPGLSDERRKELLEEGAERFKLAGINPYGPLVGAFTGQSIFEGAITDYFRVEETSSVLNFWLVVATILIAVTTLLVAVVTLVK